MILKHKVLSVDKNVATVEFENEEGKVYVRGINIPPSANGDTEHADFLDIVESHKQAIIYKTEIGVITFQDRDSLTGPPVSE